MVGCEKNNEATMHDNEERVITEFRLYDYGDGWLGLEPWIIGVPEGDTDEWREVLKCIKKQIQFNSKRLEMIPLPNGNIRWSSPRNSNGSAMEMPARQVNRFIKESTEYLDEKYPVKLSKE